MRRAWLGLAGFLAAALLGGCGDAAPTLQTDALTAPSTTRTGDLPAAAKRSAPAATTLPPLDSAALPRIGAARAPSSAASPPPPAGVPSGPRGAIEQGAERLAAGDWTGAQQAFEAASAADPRDARAHLGLAIALAQLGALDRALAEAHLALEFAPDLIAGLLTRGDIRRALRDYAAAITDYETALRLDPSLDTAHAGMALALEGQGDLAGAIASLTRAIALRPQDWALVLERSRLYLAANNTAGARTDIEFVLAREPDNPDALLRRAELRRNEGDVTGARADADRVVELYPAASLPHLVRALIRGSAGDAAGALADAEQAVALDPANPVGLRVRASLHHAAGRLREALADYDRALIAEPNDAITLNNRADALLLLGDLESALRDIERAIQLDPRLGIARYTKGQILDALRRPAEAKASYAEAARLGYTPTPEDLARVTPAVNPPAR